MIGNGALQGIPVVLYEPNAKAGTVTQALHVIARQTLLAYDSVAAGLQYKDRCVATTTRPVRRSLVPRKNACEVGGGALWRDGMGWGGRADGNEVQLAT